MKKIVSVWLAMMLLSGCALQTYCSINPPLNYESTVTAGSALVEKVECYGRVTVNDCGTGLRLIYLGKNEGKIRIQGKVDTNYVTTTGAALTLTSSDLATTRFSGVSKTPIITEILYTENSRFIEFQDVKIEVIEATDSWIKFKLIRISTQGCNKVNGQDVK